jgi:signal transduction histidine kinase
MLGSAISYVPALLAWAASDPGRGSDCRRNTRDEMNRLPLTGSRERQPARSGQRAVAREPRELIPGAGPAEIFAELSHGAGFDARDAANLRSLARIVDEQLPTILDRFNRELPLNTPAQNIPIGGAAQTGRLQDTLTDWLRSLFTGRYDARHLCQCVELGRAHARVGLPQHRPFATMEIIRQELGRIIRGADVPEREAKIDSLHKLLAIESALLTAGYQDAFVEQVRASERSAVQERLTQAEHLAQIGRLAASLAHEIKNPLAGISSAIQVIRDSMASGAPHRPILAEVLRQINRLDQTVKDLLVYARPVPPRFDRCNLSRVVERVMMVLQREPEMQRVRLEHRYDHRPLPAIEADDNQIEQLLINLLLNAAQASQDGALVTLTTKPIATGVQLEVADHGHGMDAETCRRALEPFFTTKSRGTGLGLPICHRIVEAHGGTLTLRSVPGVGTTVCLRFPLRQAHEAEGR